MATLLLFTMIVNIFIGAYSLSFDEVFSALTFSKQSVASHVLMELRIPRILLALAVGISFGVCGCIMQTLFKNPLADPSLIGVSSGASVGVVLFMLFKDFIPLNGMFGIPFFAFIGAVLTIYLIYKLSSVYNKVSVSIMLLSGIAINALLGAVIGVFTYVSDDSALRSFTFWTLGSLNGANYENVSLLLPINVVIFWVIMKKKSELNLMFLGEDEAQNSGVNVEWLKRIVVICVSLGIGVSVAYCGIIGFVGLVVPHISRLIIGSNHKYLIPFCAFFGGFTMIWADSVARVSIAPAELPIGIVTSILGAPFFMWLLLRMKRRIF